jgi:carbon-monoxide dehydrogenase medium subunit
MSFTYHEPEAISDALALSAKLGRDACYIAGGTDLVIQMRRKRTAPKHVIDLQRLMALKAHAWGTRITIGALVSHRTIEHEARQRASLIGLAESACVIGGHQVRNVGTIGGNLCNASPAADLAPILLALESEIVLESVNGQRTLPLREFLLGPGKSARQEGEILSCVTFPALPGDAATAFLKSGRRRSMEISIVSVACALRLGRLGDVLDIRIAVGAAGPVPFRATAAESALRGRPLTEKARREAGEAAAAASTPISDVRASADYRRLLVAKTVTRAIAICQSRIHGGAHAQD